MISRYLTLIIVFLQLVCIVTSCDPIDNKLRIRNESSIVLLYDFSEKPSLRLNSPFAGMFGVDETEVKVSSDDPVILPDSVVNVAIMGDWNSYIRNSTEGMVYVTLFDFEVLKKYSWEYIRDNNLYRHQYKVDEKSLGLINWELVYRE